VLGWTVVAQKGQFQVGDKCVYFEIDSILPERPEFESMRPTKFRVRTLKLRGQLSQGVCFKLEECGLEDLPVGTDVTEKLGITKYEPPVKTFRTKGGNEVPSNPRPWFVPKTDEFRIQSYPQLIDEMMDLPCYITTKLDGTSMSVFWHEGVFGVCSRNRLVTEDEEMYWSVAKRYNLHKMDANFSVVLQGELVGPGIQKNPLGLKELDFYVFNSIVDGEYEGLVNMVTTVECYGLSTVPLEAVTRFEFDLDFLIRRAEGFYESGKPKEGIVIRTTQPIHTHTLDGHLLSFKVMNNNYLLKEK
jgi:RNA ligase (TIGR02306 family)